MLEVILPGREPSPDDHEAMDALRTLVRAEEIKDSDPGFLTKVRGRLEHKMDILSRVAALLDSVEIDVSEDSEEVPDGDTRTMEDFIARVTAGGRKRAAETFETPADRARKKSIARRDKVRGSDLLTRFT